MNLFGFNIQVSRSKPGAVNQPTSAVQKAFYSPDDWVRGEEVGGPQLSNAYEQVVWVYRAINALAEQVANIPFLFSQGERGDENLITSGPLLDFYSRPHPLMNRFEYWELRVIWLMLRGECFRIPIYEDAPGHLSLAPSDGERVGVRGSHSALKQVILPDPARFQHIVEDHQLIGWRYTGFGAQTPLASQVFLPEEVWFEKLPNPFDFWRGLPPLYVAGMAAQTDFAAGAFMRGIIENNCDTGLIVRSDKWLSPEQREEIRAALRDRKRRAGQADRPVLLLGSTEVIKPQLSSSDLQFLDNRKFSRSEICAAFGVPEEIVTTTDHAKYDVMAGARLNFIENRVAPLCSRLEAEEDVTVKSIDPSASGWFDLDSLPILQEARRNRLVAAKTGFEMGIPFNELNRVLDLGFKPLAWGDSGFLSSKLQRVDSPKSSLQSPKSEEGAKERQVLFVAPHREVLPASSQGSQRSGDPWCPGKRHSRPKGVPKTNADPGAPNPLLVRKLSRFFFEQRGRVLAALPVVLRQIGSSPSSRCEPLAALLDLPFENAQLIGHLKPLVLSDFEARSLESELSGQANLPVQAEACLATRRAALEQVNVDTLERLRGSLYEGITKSELPEQLTSRVKALYNHAAEVRAEEIAGVETVAMQALCFPRKAELRQAPIKPVNHR